MAGMYRNYSEVRITEAGERYTWAGYFILVILSSFVGDSLILIATIKYRAIKLHKVIVTIMQHMAICDLLTSLAATFGPVNMIADGQVLGQLVCYLTTYIVYLTFPASFLFISAITTTKMMLLRYPLRGGVWSTRRAHLICAACWACAATVDVCLLLVDSDDISFKFKAYKCDYHFTADIWKWLRPALSVFTSLIPCIIVVVTALMLLMEARRVAKRGRGSLRWQGIMTVILTAVIYCLSILPFTLYLIAGPHLTEDPPGMFHLHFYRCAWSILMLSVVSNFYIYLLTITSFRQFIYHMFSRVARGVTMRRADSDSYIYKYELPPGSPYMNN